LSSKTTCKVFSKQRAADIQPRYPYRNYSFQQCSAEELYSFIDENENEEHEEAGASSKVANDSVFRKGETSAMVKMKEATSTEEPTHPSNSSINHKLKSEKSFEEHARRQA
jgi:hypothetical protein